MTDSVASKAETIADQNVRSDFDQELQDIADYVLNYEVKSELAFSTARHCLMDTLGCGFLALTFPACVKHLGPVVPGCEVKGGVKVPGTKFELDPVHAAFNIGAMIRWLDFNDTWLAAEWGHPSDNLGGILAVAAYVSKQNVANGKAPLPMRAVLNAMIKAHEIQGVIALENSFNRVGLDHVLLVKVATTAVVCQLLGANREQLLNALSLAWVDGQALRTYRHAPNTGPRKSWAAGDATSRGVRLSLMAMNGEMGYPSVLTAPTWGFYDVLFGGNKFKFQRPYGSYVMENVLFKISFPAEFHAQTAVEAAVTIHDKIKDRLDDIKSITLTTHESAIRIISKTGALHNPADRDHCLQYMTAIGLIYGDLKAEHYEGATATNPLVDGLREKMIVQENKTFSKDYHDPEKRSIANEVLVEMNNGDVFKECVEYPIGHKRRREEGIPVLEQKFHNNLLTQFTAMQTQAIENMCSDQDKLEKMSVIDFMDELVGK